MNVQTVRRPLLVIEDSDEDFELFQRLLTAAKVSVPVERAVSANAATARYLASTVEAAPSLVFTDLSMPDGDGFEFIAWARKHEAFSDTLLVVLSATRRGADIDKAYGLGAHFFLSKFPAPALLSGLCSAAEKKELELKARLAGFRAEGGVPV